MQLRNALLAALVAAPPFAAQAQPLTGLYIGAGGGVNIMLNEPVNSIDGTGATGLDVQTNVGGAGVVSLGWGFGNGLRAEIEGDYRYNSLDKVTGPGGSLPLNGSEQKFGPMVNALYDFTTVSPMFVPYVGVGVGYQWAHERMTSVPGSPYFAANSAGAFAYQAIVGAAIPIAPMPGLAFTVEYRFMGLSGHRSYAGVTLGNDFNNTVLVGLRYAFGAPPPPAPVPVAAPAPAPARSYLVFFDWDKATLTPRAQQIIREAATNSTRVQYTQIHVNGYTDTSGTPRYNQGLSIRRAQTVAAELVKDGVPRNIIAIQGFGETHLLVPTGPGVREPQNRRVEIIIR